MSILKKKKKTEEVVEEVTTNVEVVDEEIQTTFNDDQEGIFEDVIFIEDEKSLESSELEREDS